jgi:PAS domain S-box-containing protein
MSIRTKTLLIASVTIVGLLLTVSIISVSVLLGGVNTLEASRVETNTQRVIEAMNVTLDYLRTKTTDWAYWDDSYNFVQDKNPQYVATNLVLETFVNMNVDSILYVNTSGTFVYAKTHDEQTNTLATPSAGLLDETKQISDRLLHAPIDADITGIILLPEGPMYVSARQILHSDNTGPVEGVMLVGSYIDQQEINHLASITKTKLELYTVNDKELSPHDNLMMSELNRTKKPIVMTVISNKEIAGYALIKDIDKKDALLIDVIQNRDFYLAGIISVNYMLVGFITAGVIFLITVLLALERLVLKPLVKLRINVDQISESGDLHQRLTGVESKDELGALTKDLNKMLQSLEQSQQLLVSEQKKSQAYIDIVGVLIVIISADQRILLLNKHGCAMLEVTSEEVVGKNWFDVFIPESDREKVKAIFSQVMQGTGGDSVTHENEVITKSGKKRLIAWRNTVIRNESGAIVAALSSGEDVTDTKMSQEKILARAHELEEMNKTMIGRELKMAELKKELEELKAKLGTTQ